MPPRIDRRWSYLSLQAVILENAALRAVVLPQAGGRIWSIRHKPSDRELLWQNPRIAPRKLPFGSGYDDVWCGGWEDVFPNDAPGSILGESYPDHGEFWTLDWEWSASEAPDSAALALACEGPISGIRIEKRIALEGDSPRLAMSYRIENRGQADFPFLWKLHPAMAVTPDCRIDLPRGTHMELEPAFAGTLEGACPEFDWPVARVADRTIDLSAVPPPSSRQLYFAYGTRLPEGWCAVTDTRARLTWGLVFDPRVLRSCWLFASYGGWRNYSVAVLEPSTSHPFRIEDAIARGSAWTLAPGEALETRVDLRVQQGLARAGGLSPAGEFTE